MVHYSCDLCGRELDPEASPRFIVTIEISRVFDPAADAEEDCDRDYLQEIHELLEQTDLVDGQDDAVEQRQFDLCPECRKRFAKNPLGRDLAKQLDFSQN